MDQEHVFVVDDDRSLLHITGRFLTSAGYSIRCFERARDALEAAAQTPPTVVIADYMMPGMDGVTLLQQVKKRWPEAVRILFTGADDFDVAMSAVNAGEVYRILAKPVPPDDLRSTVASALESTRLRRDNERLASEVRRQNVELRALNSGLSEMVRARTQGLLEGLVAALDYRDTETQWHSRRVARYATTLARHLGVDGEELDTIERAALLHDIGKIAVPDAILRKPGKLSEEDWIELRKHPMKGAALLERVEYLRPASVIVAQHHEKWDGTGYPRGLAGNDIAKGARIFHVADAFDALTSDRPYRKAGVFDLASAEILRCQGTHFDPGIVEAFVQIPEAEWIAIRLEVEAVESMMRHPPGAA